MNNPIALVTGVSRLKGIGRSICTELANRGFDIFFTYWTPYDRSMPWAIASNEPQIILQEIRALGVRCEKLEIDLSKEESTYELLQNVESVLGKPHVLVNNATYSTSTDIDNISSAELDKHYHINLRATTLLSIQFIRNFNYNKNGRIINISSGQSLGPMPDEIAYAITKGAIETLTKTIYQKIAHKGITINAVNPGPTDTGWMNADIKQEIQRRFPLGRIGMPSDAAKLVGFLSSKEAEWITGQVIHSEGGFTR